MAGMFLTSAVYGFLAPPLLIVLILVTNNRAIMGDRVNGRWANTLGWTATLRTAAAALALVVSWLRG